jgi:D-tyrosyl-tRNA(Tyr) deacylase
MSNNKRAIYYICNNPSWGHVARHVWNILEEEGYLSEPTGIIFDGGEVMKYTDAKNNEFYFAPTETAICLDYPRYLPDMNKHFADFDISGMVTWHEGASAPDNVLTVHSLGDINSGIYGPAKPKYMRNLLLAMDRNRQDLGLDDYSVVTEATHWSGAHEDGSDPSLLLKYPVAMMDIEVGSDESSWSNLAACRVLARSLTKIFDDDGKKVHNMLCVGGIHFDPNFRGAVFTEWDNEAFGITHIIANQWLVAGEYENGEGLKKIMDCISAIDGGIEAIAFHDKMKACYKDLVRKLGEEYNIPIYKHQRLRKPQGLDLK